MNGIALEKFLDFFPVFDVKKFFTRRKTKESPPYHREKCVVSINPGASGAIYVTPQGRVVFWPAHSDGKMKNIAEARYLLQPPSEIHMQPAQCQVFLTREKLGPLDEAEHVSAADKCSMIHYLYGKNRASAILALFQLA